MTFTLFLAAGKVTSPSQGREGAAQNPSPHSYLQVNFSVYVVCSLRVEIHDCLLLDPYPRRVTLAKCQNYKTQASFSHRNTNWTFQGPNSLSGCPELWFSSLKYESSYLTVYQHEWIRYQLRDERRVHISGCEEINSFVLLHYRHHPFPPNHSPMPWWQKF